MPRFAANLTMLFTEMPFLERFRAARETGFRAVECLFPYGYGLETVGMALEQNGLRLVLFNLPCGDWAAGDRGIAGDERRREEFRQGVKQAAAWAHALGVQRVNCLAGKSVPQGVAGQWETLIENVSYAASVLGGQGVNLMVENVNRHDVPGFLLNTTGRVMQLLRAVNAPNAYLQYDVYHAQREEGDLVNTLRRLLPWIGHIQIADNPGRHQPGTGEINYSFLFRELDRMGYEGYVSLEYIPYPDTISSLDWLEEYGYTPA